MIIDAGVLISVDRNDRAALHLTATIERQVTVVHTTEAVVAQVSRSGRQARLRRFLTSAVAEVHALDDGHRVGAVLASASTSDVVDAHLALIASVYGGPLLTSDVDDLEHLRSSNGFTFDVLSWP